MTAASTDAPARRPRLCERLDRARHSGALKDLLAEFALWTTVWTGVPLAGSDLAAANRSPRRRDDPIRSVSADGTHERRRTWPIRLLGAAAQAARASERRNVPWKLLLTLAALATTVAAAVSAPASATTSATAPEALTRARVIRAEVNARYRLMPGRRLVVTETTSTAVVESLTLLADWLEPPRVAPADNGIYFAICSARAKCPYPARSAAWPATAFLPRRQALELALLTFLQTSVRLVVVALPTAQPVWIVFERDDLVADLDEQALLDQLAAHPAAADPEFHDTVGRITRTRLFRPLPILPPPDDTIYALRLIEP